VIVEGDVVLEEPTRLANAAMRVVLEDVSMLDAPARAVALSERTVSGRAVKMLPFRLEVARVPPAHRRYALTAEIRAGGHARLEPGDFLSTVAVPWSPGAPRSWLRIPVQRIKS